MREGYPDHLLLKRGDTWTLTDKLNPVSGRSASEPVLISAYGTGARPIISNGTTDLVRAISDEYQAYIGLHFDGTGRAVADGADNLTGFDLRSSGDDILLEDCLIDSFGKGVNIAAGSFTNITVRRNVIVNSWNDWGKRLSGDVRRRYGRIDDRRKHIRPQWLERCGRRFWCNCVQPQHVYHTRQP